ncbi:hypothetical protein BC939DRAFT_472245 [Gamsiella multidivaricata]|uniref:uncharacterized protein n=1 Tax=Gamsiella multidivaricata TaxID=101098 RepID=UPI00221ED202|nr:uncharacterized protein BC939DRAFT_472245 [Gamsiella multidivaricata]KAI7832648.1 hypothetical protein BC939DRAFT_472245 [Gamsiella multidivaricata]
MATRTSDPSHERVDSIWKFIEPQLQPSATPVTVNNASFSYRTYLTYLIQRAQDLDRAAELIDKMTIRDISPELERYQKTAHAVIRRLIHHGYLTEVQKLLSQKDATLAKAISPTAWGDLMDAYVARGEHQKARWTYNDMIRYEVQPSTKCKKMFSDLQLMGGTTDRGGPEVAGAGTGVEARAAASREEANILSILFNRQPKPTLS